MAERAERVGQLSQALPWPLDRHGREINRYSRIGAELAAWVLAMVFIFGVVRIGIWLYDLAHPT